MTANQILSDLQGLENFWRNSAIATWRHNPDPGMLTGQLQFFSLEPEDVTKMDSDVVPVIIAIGINYGQPPPAPTAWGRPYHKTVLDPGPSAMRRELNRAIDAYLVDPSAWDARFHASSDRIKIDKKYHLIATNFCPFITWSEWLSETAKAPKRLNYPSARRVNALSLIDAQRTYLHDLVQFAKRLSQPVIWVGHGMHSEVFSLFRMFQKAANCAPWLLTPGLNGRPYRYPGFGNVSMTGPVEKPKDGDAHQVP